MKKNGVKLLLIGVVTLLASTTLHAEIINVTTMDQFNQTVIQASKPAVISFCACWCSECKAVNQAFIKLASKYADQCVFVTVDAMKSNDIAVANKVKGVPTFLFFKNGKQVASASGMVSLTALEDKIKSAS